MIAPRWLKAMRDLVESPVRAGLAVLAMTAGAFGVGMIVTSYTILTRELATTYSSTKPASAILYAAGIDDARVAQVRALPGVRDAEARPTIHGRIRTAGGEWKPLTLFVVRDFDDLRVDLFRRDAGSWPPRDDEVLLERSSLAVAHATIGDRVIVKTSDGGERTLRLAGTVHAAGLAPGWMDHQASGFVSDRFVLRGNRSREVTRLMIMVSGNPLDERHIRTVAAGVKSALEGMDRKVLGVDIPRAGRHPHADQMDTFLFLLGTFGALTLALSAVLAANMIHSLLTEQVREIGVMKATGATTGQIAALYLGQVAMLAATALCLGMPLGFAAGQGYARFAASILNATITSSAVPAWAVAVQIAVGLLVPLTVALGPVSRAAGISIHQAFSSDVSAKAFGVRWFDRWLASIRWLPRPFMLSLRTLFHRRGRLLLSVGTLAAGGAVFITTLNVAAGWSLAIDSDARTRRYDLDVRLTSLYPAALLGEVLAGVPEVARAECWPDGSAVLTGSLRRVPALRAHGLDDERVQLVGADAGSPLLAPHLLQGRWLTAEDREAVVINQGLLAHVPTLRLGERLPLRVDGQEVAWPVVGVVKELVPTPIAYAPARTVSDAMHQQPGMSRSIRVLARRRDTAGVRAASRGIERALLQRGIGVGNLQPLSEWRKALEDHLVIINTALMLAAGLVVLVGALGLISTMTMGVVERRCELGVLSAIGASPRAVAAGIVCEGLLTGALSWCAAVCAAIPLTYLIGAAAGRIFIKSELDLVMSPAAAAAWLLLVLLLVAASSFYPAWRSTQLTVREALAYE
ncbi:MAG: FtsX-like permease family protein [Acidobacteria bacterium]|nr:FtsX-like permease family protein [Acidobacteriota bacterium]